MRDASMSQCQQQFSTTPSSLPPTYRQHAANLARWFPEVLLALGAPGLEESYIPAGPHVSVGPAGQTIEVVLERRPQWQPSPATGGISMPTMVQSAPPASASALAPKDLSATLAGLEALTLDFEALAARRFSPPTLPLSQGSSVEMRNPGEQISQNQHLLRRLDTAAEEILKITSQLQVAGAYIPRYESTNHQVASEPPVAPVLEQRVRVASPSSIHSTSARERERKRERAKEHFKRYSSAPACADPNEREVAFVKELTPCTPGSARGGQAHQGQVPGRQAGRSRGANPKAALWRTQRESTMKISVHKVSRDQLPKEEPASPKFQKPTKVWGPQNQNKSESKGRAATRRSSLQVGGEICEDRSAAAIKARIDRKLSLLFGPSKVTRSQSIAAHGDAEAVRRQLSA